MTPTDTVEPKDLAELTPHTEEAHAHDEPGHEGHEPSQEDHAGHDHSHEGHSHDAPALNPALVREITVEVPADEVSKSFRAVTKRYQRLARIPGFRVGKVPESVIRGKFMREIRQEVLEQMVSGRFQKALEEQNLTPASQAQFRNLNLMDGHALTFTAAFEILPKIDLTGYETIQVPRPDVAVTEDEFASEVDHALEPHATVEPVDEERALADGDWAEIGFVGRVQELAQTVGEEDENKPEAQPITGDDVLVQIGGKDTLSAFTEALRGANVGQEMEIEVAYPEDFGDRRLAGQTVAYDVTVKAIKRKTYPERDAEFAKQLGNYESWEEFETRLRERLAERKKDALENAAKDRMVGELIQRFAFEVPETAVQRQIDARLDRMLRNLAQQGMKAEDMRRLDFNSLREGNREQAINEVKASLILDEIADAEHVEVSEDEINREVLMMSIQGREPYEAIHERLAKDGGIERIREHMRRQKAGDVLFEKLAS